MSKDPELNALAAALPSTATLFGPRASVTKYSPELMATILDRVAAGETVRSICREPGMPSVVSLRKWVLTSPELREAWQTARQLKGAAVFDEALDRARELGTDAVPPAQIPAIARLLEHLRWAAAKLSPTEFGDRQPNVPTLAIQINTTLDLGQGGVAAEASTASVYQLEVPVGNGDGPQEHIVNVPLPRRPGRKPKKRINEPVEVEYEHVSTDV